MSWYERHWEYASFGTRIGIVLATLWALALFYHIAVFIVYYTTGFVMPNVLPEGRWIEGTEGFRPV